MTVAIQIIGTHYKVKHLYLRSEGPFRMLEYFSNEVALLHLWHLRFEDNHNHLSRLARRWRRWAYILFGHEVEVVNGEARTKESSGVSKFAQQKFATIRRP